MNTRQDQPPTTAVPSSGPRAASSPALDDPRVIAALDEYLAGLETGEKPNRQAFLARHADIAEALAECLDGMEALHLATSSPHQGRGGTGVTDTGGEWQPGMPLGDFRLIREIGRGGMGVVYEAEQLSLSRRIALKILPFALTLDPRQLQRFKNEARAAAQLHHQHIVPVHAVGCERGVHFFAMQYIEGQTLGEVIEELRQIAGPRPASAGTASRRRPPAEEPTGPYLSPAAAATADTVAEPTGALATAYSTNSPQFFRTVAQLGVQGADALEHAHQYGVVHRDIKPSNLIVDVRGHLWVTDFGLAQFQSDAALTLTGDLLGTLRYMSPEQALAKRGLVDHRTDIYSLGATLYELLTHEPVYDGRDREELLRQIAFEEPRPPRRWSPAIPADLETIVLKAMAKRVEERYATAGELADDLRRFLEHKPIRARRPTLLETTAKWARRHRALAGAAVVLLVLAAMGSGLSTWLIAREQSKTQQANDRLKDEKARTLAALDQAQQKAKEAREQGALAEKNFQHAREAVDFLTQVGEEELAGKPQPELGDLRRRLLEAALVYYKSFIRDRQDDPSSQEELTKAQTRVAAILAELAAGDRLWRVGLLTHLLDSPAVRTDLGLTEEQEAKAKRLRARPPGRPPQSVRDVRQLSPQDRRQQLLEGVQNAEKNLEDILEPDQRQRLTQIDLQLRGLSALSDPEVADALKLSAGQKQRIRAIQTAARKTTGGPLCHPGPPPEAPKQARQKGKPGQYLRLVIVVPPEGPKQSRQNGNSTSRELMAVLTPAQRVLWEEMLGKPVQGEIWSAPEGHHGPGHGFPHHGDP